MVPQLQQSGYAVSPEQSAFDRHNRIFVWPVGQGPSADGGLSLQVVAVVHEAVMEFAVQLGTVPPVMFVTPQQS